MAEFPALPLWTDAFIADTVHLSAEEVGVYMLLLFAAWRRPGCDLPDDDKFLAAIARCDGRRGRMWQRNMRPVMEPFFLIEDGLWKQKRLTKERQFVREHTERMSAMAKARWSKNKDIADATALLQQCYSNAPTPTPKEEEESKKPVVVRAASPRARRWGSNEVVSSEWMGDAQVARLRNGLPEIDVLLEAEKFANFWASKSGAQATKLDWHRTWINWYLKAEAPRHAGRPQSAHDKFIAAGLSIIRGLAGPGQAGDDPEDDGAGETGRPLPPA